MTTKTTFIMTTLHVIAWILFVGLCIETGILLFSFVVNIVVNNKEAENLYKGLNLATLYQYSIWQYVAVSSLLIFLSGLKAFIFYLVIQIFTKINLINPFSLEVSTLISKISYVALQIGILSIIVSGYIKWLAKRGIELSNVSDYLGGASEYLLLGGVIFMIAQIFKRGIEIQTENELTI